MSELSEATAPFTNEAGITRTLVSGVRFANNLRRENEAFKKSVGKPSVGPEQVYNTGMSPYKQVKRGILAYKNAPEKLYLFQFNPTTLTDEKSTRYADVERPNRQFVDPVWSGGGPRILAFELFMDATAGSNTPEFTSTPLGNKGFETLEDLYPNGVVDDVQFLQSFLYPTLSDAEAPRFLYGGAAPAEQFAAPPTAVFVYGNFYFEGLVKTVNPEYTLFDHRLIPRRCNVQVTFQVFEEEFVRPNQSLRKSHFRK